MSDVNSVEIGTRPRSCLLFIDQLPEIAKCDECEVLVPLPNFEYGSKKGSSKIGFFKRKKKEQPLHSFGLCTILLLEYTSNEEFVNIAVADNQVYRIKICLIPNCFTYYSENMNMKLIWFIILFECFNCRK